MCSLFRLNRYRKMFFPLFISMGSDRNTTVAVLEMSRLRQNKSAIVGIGKHQGSFYVIVTEE